MFFKVRLDASVILTQSICCMIVDVLLIHISINFATMINVFVRVILLR